jgi:hypothetical protein
MPTAILLDGTPLDCREPGLAGAINAGQAAAGTRLIVEVRVDGAVVDPDQLGPDLAELRGVERVEMLSAHPSALARCTVLDAADALEEIATVQADAAGLLQTGETDRAMGLLRRTLEVWGGVAQTIDLVGRMGLARADSPPAVALAAGTAHPRLNACLHAARVALEAQDHAALADVLAYDLRDLAREWTGELRLLADEIDREWARTGTVA